MKSKILLVDGDILNFTICRITEDITDFGDQQMKSFSEEDTIRLLRNGIKSISEKTGVPERDIVYAISDDGNFRKKLFPTYKSNRKDVVKPLGLKFLRKYLLDNVEEYNTVMLEDLEADDVLGILASGSTEDDKVLIYSQDKDLKTIACEQWDFKKGKFITINQLEADRWLYKQVLMGDTVDGYCGCPRIGVKKATRALLDAKSEYDMLKRTYALFYKYYKDEAHDKLLEQMGQARILRSGEERDGTFEGRTYNPFEELDVSSETLSEWEKEIEDGNK